MAGRAEKDRAGGGLAGRGAGDGELERGLPGILRIGLGLVAALCCGLVFAVWLPADARREADFAAARPCAAGMEAGVAAGERADCLLGLPATVEGVTARKTAGSRAWVTLPATPGRTLGLDFKDSGPLLYRLRPGDRVTVTFWRGEAVGLERDGSRLRSAAAPRREGQITAGIGTFAGLMAVLGLGTGISVLRSAGRRRDGSPDPLLSAAKPLSLIAMLVCAAVAAVALQLGAPSWIVPAAAVPVVAAAAQAFRWRCLREGWRG